MSFFVFLLFAVCVLWGGGMSISVRREAHFFHSRSIDRARAREYTCTAVFMSRCPAAALLSVCVFVRRGKCRF